MVVCRTDLRGEPLSALSSASLLRFRCLRGDRRGRTLGPCRVSEDVESPSSCVSVVSSGPVRDGGVFERRFERYLAGGGGISLPAPTSVSVSE